MDSPRAPRKAATKKLTEEDNRTNATASTTIVLTPLHESMAPLFNDCQMSATTHRKNAVSLTKLFFCRGRLTPKQPLIDSVRWIEQFHAVFVDHLNIVLGMKKNEQVTTRLLKFITVFFAVGSERSGNEILHVSVFVILLEKQGEDGPDLWNTFMETLIQYLLQGVSARDKQIRFRVCHLISHAMDVLSEVSEALWSKYKKTMHGRLIDKEANVRVQALNAMARLQDSEEVDEAGVTVIDMFIDMMRHDPSADVRKAALLNIEISIKTLPAILERSRDVDANVRKCFYRRKMDSIDWRTLTIEQRQRLIEDGLQDREVSVQKSCLYMLFGNWIRRVENNIILLLSCVDVISCTKSAELLLSAYFGVATQLTHEFDDNYWDNLTPEMVVYLRLFCEHIRDKQSLDQAQDSLPESSKFMRYLEKYYQFLVQATDVDDKLTYGFILTQLLKLAPLLDVSDEVGRCCTLKTMQSFIKSSALEEDALQSCMDLLQKVTVNQDEFSQTVIQLIHDVSESLVSQLAEKEEADVEDDEEQVLSSMARLQLEGNPVVDPTKETLKCLLLTRKVLQQTQQSLRHHPLLGGLVNELVIPAINSNVGMVQERGLECLGMACVLDKDLAVEYMQLFVSFAQIATGTMQLTCLSLIFDLLILFGVNDFSVDESAQNADEEDSPVDPIQLLKSYLANEDPSLQALAVEGFSKLFLLKVYQDADVLAGLMLLYFHPNTRDNQRLRQCLSYFLHVYAWSATEHQWTMAQVFMSTMEALQALQHHFGDIIISPLQAGQMLIDWMDYKKLHKSVLQQQEKVESLNSHLFLAEALLEAAKDSHSAPQTKLYCQLLSHLRLEFVGDEKRQLFVQLCKAVQVTDRVALNALKKCQLKLGHEEKDDQDSEEEDEALQTGEESDE